MGAMSSLSHLDSDGRARMVDVGDKAVTERSATARARFVTTPEVMALVRADGLPKADVLATARIAGIAGAKRTSELIPLCHPHRSHERHDRLSPLRRLDRDHGDREDHGSNGRRDGSLDGRHDRRTHASRHDQGRRSAIRARRDSSDREDRWKVAPRDRATHCRRHRRLYSCRRRYAARHDGPRARDVARRARLSA